MIKASLANLAIFFSLFLPGMVTAQNLSSATAEATALDPAPFANQVLLSGNKLIQALADFNCEETLKYFHPDYANKITGPDEYLYNCNDAKSLSERENLQPDYSLKSPSQMVKTENGLMGVCELTMTLKNPGENSMSTYYLVCISGDQGKTWLFVPIFDNDPATMAYLEEISMLGLTIEKFGKK